MTIEPFIRGVETTLGSPVPWTHICCVFHEVQSFPGLLHHPRWFRMEANAPVVV